MDTPATLTARSISTPTKLTYIHPYILPKNNKASEVIRG